MSDKDKICPLMSKMAPSLPAIATGKLSIQLAAVPCAGPACGWWAETVEQVEEPGKETREVLGGYCAVLSLAGEVE
jgi:hypothetical protein